MNRPTSLLVVGLAVLIVCSHLPASLTAQSRTFKIDGNHKRSFSPELLKLSPGNHRGRRNFMFSNANEFSASFSSAQGSLTSVQISSNYFGGQKERRQGSLLWPIAGGLLAGGLGALGGGLLGSSNVDSPGCDFCGVGGFITGAVIGEATLTPLGVHLGNSRRGSFGLGLLTSLAVVGGALALASGTYGDELTTIAIVAPILQLSACIAIERATGRSRNIKQKNRR